LLIESNVPILVSSVCCFFIFSFLSRIVEHNT
jgi:hypothetical protein